MWEFISNGAKLIPTSHGSIARVVFFFLGGGEVNSFSIKNAQKERFRSHDVSATLCNLPNCGAEHVAYTLKFQQSNAWWGDDCFVVVRNSERPTASFNFNVGRHDRQ